MREEKNVGEVKRKVGGREVRKRRKERWAGGRKRVERWAGGRRRERWVRQYAIIETHSGKPLSAAAS